MKLEDYKADMQRCSQCSYCEFIPFDHMKSLRFSLGCPSVAYKKYGTYSARGKYGIAWALLDGRSTYESQIKDIVYTCLLCGSCDIACKICRYDLQPLDTWREFRAKLVEDGQSLPQHIATMEHLRKENNIMMEPGAKRGDWAKGLDVQCITDKPAEVLFYAGCRYSYDKELKEVARTAVTLLKNAGVDVGIMGKSEMCCGGRVYDLGYQQDFTKLAESNIKAWAKAGVKRVVTSCSDCYHAFKRLYPRVGSKFEVLHTVEYIDQLIKEGKIKFTKSLPMKITYHDPCHLGRQGEPYVPWQGRQKKIRNHFLCFEPKKPRYNGIWGIYDAPRDVLKSIPGLELVEMERIREYAWCCGGGGGVREAYPDFSNWTATERIEEAESTGAEAIVSACPWCESNFIDAINNVGGKMKVFDIAELVKQAI